MTVVGCWRFTGTPTQNGVVLMGSNETTPPRLDSLLGEFTKASESQTSKINLQPEWHMRPPPESATAIGLQPAW